MYVQTAARRGACRAAGRGGAARSSIRAIRIFKKYHRHTNF
jgi:hypothetical protein